MSELDGYNLHECPFCGGGELEVGGNATEGTAHLRCKNCGAQGPESPFVWAAIDGWNSRTSFPDEPISYTVTPAGKAALRGEG